MNGFDLEEELAKACLYASVASVPPDERIRATGESTEHVVDWQPLSSIETIFTKNCKVIGK